VKYDYHPACLLTTATANNIENVRDVIAHDCRLGVRAISVMVNIDRENFRRILANELYTKKVCASMVPKMPSTEKKNFDRKFVLIFATYLE